MKPYVSLLLTILLAGCGGESTPPAETQKPSTPNTGGPKPASVATSGAIGSIIQNGVGMPIADAAVIWTPAEGRLKLLLFPVKLNETDQEKAAEGNSFFIVFDKASPDKSKWADWCPVAEIEMGFTGNDPGKPANFLYLMAYGFEKKNTTDNLSFNGPDIAGLVKTLNLNLSEGLVDVKIEGSQELAGSKCNFDITLKGAPLVIKQ